MAECKTRKEMEKFEIYFKERFGLIAEKLNELSLTVKFEELESEQLREILDNLNFVGTVLMTKNKKTYCLLEDSLAYHMDEDLENKLFNKLETLEGYNFKVFVSYDEISNYVN